MVQIACAVCPSLRVVSMVNNEERCSKWIARFHAGDRRVIEQCYRENFSQVMDAVGRLLSGADQETVVHDVFCKLLDNADARAQFGGGNFTAWLRTIARNRAIDYVRRHGRETSVEPDTVVRLAGSQEHCDSRLELTTLLARFVRDHVPKRLVPLFRSRFIEQRSQQETADAIGLPRTTVAYHEMRLRKQLRRFVLRTEALS